MKLEKLSSVKSSYKVLKRKARDDSSLVSLLEVLAARDWKQHALAPAGRDCGAVEGAIDAACTKMDKTREKLACVLRCP